MKSYVTDSSAIARFGRADAEFHIAWAEHSTLAERMLRLDSSMLDQVIRKMPFNTAAADIARRGTRKITDVSRILKLRKEDRALYAAVTAADALDVLDKAIDEAKDALRDLKVRQIELDDLLTDIDNQAEPEDLT